MVDAMHNARFDANDRVTAVLALLGFALITIASAGVFAAAGDESDEDCASCSGCETGECDDENGGLASHHHCCATSCIAHSVLTLPPATSLQAQLTAELLPVTGVAALSPRNPEPPKRPPRS